MASVKGLSEVRAYIGGIPARMQPILREAGKAGAAVIADEIALRTPSSEVRDALRTTSKTADGRITVKIDLEPGWGRSVGIWMEYGTAPHFISVDESQRQGRSITTINRRVGDNDGNGSLVIGGKFVGKTVFHPGAQAHPAFRPALDSKRDEALAAAQAYVNSKQAAI